MKDIFYLVLCLTFFFHVDGYLDAKTELIKEQTKQLQIANIR